MSVNNYYSSLEFYDVRENQNVNLEHEPSHSSSSGLDKEVHAFVSSYLSSQPTKDFITFLSDSLEENCCARLEKTITELDLDPNETKKILENNLTYIKDSCSQSKFEKIKHKVNTLFNTLIKNTQQENRSYVDEATTNLPQASSEENQQRNEITILRNNFMKLQSQLIELLNDNAEFKKVTADLRKELQDNKKESAEEINKLKKEIQSLKTDNEELKKQLVEKDKENARLKEENKRQAEEIKKLKDKISQLEKEKPALTTQTIPDQKSDRKSTQSKAGITKAQRVALGTTVFGISAAGCVGVSMVTGGAPAIAAAKIGGPVLAKAAAIMGIDAGILGLSLGCGIASTTVAVGGDKLKCG